MPESYQYRAGYRGPRKVLAEVAAAELGRLRTDGDLTAPRVVEAAEPETAPLHAAFEWDDSAAAREFRLVQARTLIRAVVVVTEKTAEAPSSERSVYVHVPDQETKEGKYLLLEQVADDDAEYARALAEAGRYLTSAEQRFSELRRLVEGKGTKSEALAIATAGFSAVREALALLKVAA
jgi:hypothetical protein